MKKRRLAKRRRNFRPHVEQLELRLAPMTLMGLGIGAAILSSLNSNGVHEDSLLITNARHYDLLCNTQREIEVARTALCDRYSEELVLAPLHNALRFLGQITGETTTEDILSEIFATFCIGK